MDAVARAGDARKQFMKPMRLPHRFLRGRGARFFSANSAIQAFIPETPKFPYNVYEGRKA